MTNQHDDALAIMDEIERDPMNRGSSTTMSNHKQWQRLRTAIEELQGELEQAKKGWETTSEYAKGCGDTIAMLQARIARLEEALNSLLQHWTQGNDFFHGDALPSTVSEAIDVLNESAPQSAAKVNNIN